MQNSIEKFCYNLLIYFKKTSVDVKIKLNIDNIWQITIIEIIKIKYSWKDLSYNFVMGIALYSNIGIEYNFLITKERTNGMDSLCLIKIWRYIK